MTKRLTATLVATLLLAALPISAVAHDDQEIRDRLAALERRMNEHRAFHNAELTDFEKSVFLASGRIAELLLKPTTVNATSARSPANG